MNKQYVGYEKGVKVYEGKVFDSTNEAAHRKALRIASRVADRRDNKYGAYICRIQLVIA